MGSALVSQISKELLALISSQYLEGYVNQFGVVDHSDLGIQGGINTFDSSGSSWQDDDIRHISL